MILPASTLQTCRHEWWYRIVFPIIAFLSWAQPVHAEPRQAVRLFTSIDALRNFSAETPGIDDSHIRPAVDVLYSYSHDRFRFLAEYLLSNEESELERMKAGWQFSDHTVLWLGRFHATSKYWTTEYHHGQFMQMSITRPSIEEWEDESGPMPSHITGLSLEHESIRPDDSAIDYAFSVGLGSRFAGEGLRPFDLLDPESGHDVSFNYRMVYKPDVLSLKQVGFLAAWNEIDIVSASNPNLMKLDHVRQFTAGMFVDWNWGQWRLVANVVYFNNDMQYFDAGHKDEFMSGYAQAEFQASEDWTVFGRSENSFNEENSPYLGMLPAFITRRNMLGVRWDLTDVHSLTVEIADTRAQGNGFNNDDFNEIRIQWSAVFP